MALVVFHLLMALIVCCLLLLQKMEQGKQLY